MTTKPFSLNLSDYETRESKRRSAWLPYNDAIRLGKSKEDVTSAFELALAECRALDLGEESE